MIILIIVPARFIKPALLMQQALSQATLREHPRVNPTFSDWSHIRLDIYQSMRNVIRQCRKIVSRAGAILIEDSHSGTVARTNHFISQPGPRICHPFHANIHAGACGVRSRNPRLVDGVNNNSSLGQTMNYRVEFFRLNSSKVVLDIFSTNYLRCLPGG